MTDLTEAIWRLPTVCERTGLSKSTIDRLVHAGKFPSRRRIGDTAVGWLASEIVQWMRDRPAADLAGIRSESGAENG